VPGFFVFGTASGTTYCYRKIAFALMVLARAFLYGAFFHGAVLLTSAHGAENLWLLRFISPLEKASASPRATGIVVGVTLLC
jgi:hypothetical protein